MRRPEGATNAMEMKSLLYRKIKGTGS